MADVLGVVDRSRLWDVTSLYVWNAEFAEGASLAQMAVAAVLFQGRFGWSNKKNRSASLSV